MTTFVGEYLTPSYRSPDRENRSEQPSFELFLATPPTLSDHLNWQLNLNGIPSEIREIGYFIVGNINEDGYLMVSVEEIVESLQASSEKLKRP